MKHRVRSFFALLLCLLTVAAALPASALAMEDGMFGDNTTLQTTYCWDNYLDFTINGTKLEVSGRILLDGLRQISVHCGGQKAYVHASSGELFSVTLNIRGDDAEVKVYTQTKGDEYFRSALHSSVYLWKTADGYRFPDSPVLENNRKLAAQWVNPASTLRATVPEAVRAMSDTIVGDETDDYQKVFLLYQWVVENLHYNYDVQGLNFISTEFTLVSRQAICTGFARLLRDLILAQNIPSMESTTFALGYDTHGKTFAHYPDYGALTVGNHAHTEAFVDGRWVVMDPTFDCRNAYQGGQFITNPTTGYTYFDVTPAFFAAQHKVISRNDRGILLQKDGSVVNYEAELPGKVPSDWALKECTRALSLELIPDELQGCYQTNISRRYFCRLIVNMLRKRAEVTDNTALLARHGKTMTQGLFTDTADADIYTAALLGIVNGVGNGRFDPDKPITREAAATMLSRAANLLGLQPTGQPKQFSDMSQVSSWAADSVRRVSAIVSTEGAAVMGGTGTGFSPTAYYTVEQSILTVYRLYMCW